MRAVSIIASACILSSCALWDAASGSPEDPSGSQDTSQAEVDVITMDSVEEMDSVEDIADVSEVHDADPDDAFGCAQVNLDHLFNFTFGEMTSQFQASTAFDGEAVWVVYVGATGFSETDALRNIYVTRILCDGTTALGPIVVNQNALSEGFPEPSIDIKGQTVYLSWMEENPAGPSKLAVWFRTLSLDGTWLMEQDKAISFQLDADGPTEGNPITQAFYRNDIAGLNSDFAVVAATALVDDRRQILVQKVSSDGAFIGSATPVFDTEGYDFSYPRVTAEAPDKIWVSAQKIPFNAGTVQTLYPSVYRSFNPEDATAEVEVKEAPTLSPQYRYLPWVKDIRKGEDLLFAYVTVQNTITQIRIADPANQFLSKTVADTPKRNDFPALTASEDGGAVAWFHWNGTDFFTVKVYARAFHRNGNAFELDEPKLLAEFESAGDSEAPGGPSIVYVGGNRYFVVWAERSGLSVSTIKARFVEL